MSADDFQTKYSSVMEGMLKSAVAETTKLFETMVDDLKAEISMIKKENEDLKRKCSQFERATRQTRNEDQESESNPRNSAISEKRDTAIQCDLVPFRAMLVEQCEPLQPSTWQDQEQPCGYDTMKYVWQEHNYENREGRSSQMAFILVKPKDSLQQTAIKQEEVEPLLSCEQILGTNVAASACKKGADRPNTNQESSTAETQLPERNEETGGDMELPQLKRACSLVGVHNLSSGLEHSLPAVKDNLNKETQDGLQLLEIKAQGELDMSERHPLTVTHCWSEAKLQESELSSHDKIPVNEQTDAGFSNQLVDKPTPPARSETNDDLTNSKMSETEPDQPVRRKRGRPPKKSKQKPIKPINIQKCTSENKTSEHQQFSKPTKSPRERRTSATLQDAMLLVEAMNQSSDKDAPSSPQGIAATTQTLQTVHELPVEPEKEDESIVPVQATTPAEDLVLKKTVAPKQQQPVVTASCADTSSEATSTSVSLTSVHQPQIKSVTHSKRGDAVTRKIIVMSRSSASLMHCKFAGKAATQLPAVVSKVIAAQNNSELPTPTDIPPEKPSPCSTLQKTVFNTPDKSLPAPSTDSQSASLSQPKITILIPRQLSAVALNKQSQVIDLTTNQESATSSNPNVEPSQLIPLSQEVHEATTVSTTELINTSDNMDSQTQAMKESTVTAEQTPPAVVRLTRLPFPMSAQEAASLVSLYSSKTSNTLSPPKEESPSVVVSTQPSETQVSSSEICVTTIEACEVGLKAPVLNVSPNSGCVAADLSTSKLEKEMDTAVQDSTSSNVPAIKQPSPSVIHLMSIKSRDMADPHSQMTKTQFLAQLAVSPILHDQEEPPIGDSVADDASCPMTSTSEETSLQENNLVAKLRCHLRTHLQTRHAKASQEVCIETDILSASPKTPESEADSSDISGQTVEPILLNPRKPLTVMDMTSPCKKNNDSSSVSTRKSKRSSGEPVAVSPQRLRATSESTPVSLRRGRDCVSLKNKKSTFVSPRKSNLAQEERISNKRQIIPHSPRRSSLTKERASLRKIKTTTVHYRRTSTLRDSSSHPTNTETPKTTKTTGSSLKTTSNESTSFVRRRCTFSQVSSVTKPSKSESDVFTTRICDISTDVTSVKGIGSGTNLHSEGELGSPESVRSRRTGESTPALKRRLIPESSSPKENLEVASCKRLAKAATAKTEARIQSKPSAGPENLRKLTSKSIWTPPILSVCDTPLAEENSPNSTPIKTESKTLNTTLVYPPSVSLHPIPVWAPPVVSPLQPLSVIGWRLLKNQCGECGRVLSSSAALESHVSLHTGHRPFSCKLCGKRFPDSKGLKRHGRVHRNGRIHICKQCGKGFVYSFGLTKHLQMVHSRIKPFVCQVCNKGFFSKRDVEAHIRIHTGEKPFHCNLCEKKFARRTELNVHLRWHNGEKRHWCPFCGKGFLDINNLKRHKYTHTGEKPHSCPHCPKHFTQSGHLKKHVRNVHKIQ